MGKRMNFVVFKEKRHIIWLRFMKTKCWRYGFFGFIKKKHREYIEGNVVLGKEKTYRIG